MGSEIYFDNNATTRVLPEVFEAMAPFYTDYYGNPSSIHRFGSQVANRIDQARVEVAGLIGAADPVEIIFTSCGTEGNNAAIRGLLEMQPGRSHIVTTQVEHPAVLGLCQHLEKKGCRVTWLGVDQDGTLDLDELRDSITEETAVVSVMFANNETGVIFPIRRIGEIVKAKGALFHVDAVQAAGKIPIELKESTVDLLTISAHKFHGPKGVGVLYVRRGVRFPPFIIGGHQERNRRAGTENVAAIVGMGRAAELASKRLDDDTVQVQALRDQLQNSLLETCPGARVNGNVKSRLPNTLNMSFSYLEGESILVLLDQHNICASTGSACTSGSSEPSHVLRAMKTPPDWLQGAVRFSLSRFNTADEVRFVSEKMPEIVRRLEGLSALGKLGDGKRNPPSAQPTSNAVGARG